ncbi:uncharacterized protein LOC131601811 [Vicia villosa]|uniref:uncharacterized protein LOC131601811 n=1 Tax=Vicia villosa TaxID=3911 RepID=UPI00273B5265|nr:uncharacterized protein LOC131601811 [Vicia villosa]XP_058729686.1 uncharacterized protein LOC131601811 [Vicia villosa]XP_058729687.1 uncharacterized protein LOC131601811 [Vicia villosa]XP_058729688.1 uncharacterized protein LOC131601811 [Vicia villosa]
MADQEKHNMEVRMEIDELKSGMIKLTEMMQVLMARTDPPQRTVISEVSTAVVDPLQVQKPPSTWPEFGLPENFSPTYVNASMVGQTSRQIFQPPVFSEPPPVVHTVAQAVPAHYDNPLYDYRSVGSQSVSQGDCGEVEEVREQYQALEKRLRAMEGRNFFSVNADNMGLVSNLVMPSKFKVPEFEKYKGHTCPRSHLTMYYRKMTAYTNNQNLLIHCFQDSLSGASLKWYMSLEKGCVQDFQDLADAFMEQYKYNLDMAPDRRQLQNMAQKEKESFKEYAQRWRELASQVEPPLSEKELTSLFMDTLSPFFWEKMIGSVSSNFTDLVTIGQRLEEGIKKGKVSVVVDSSKKPFGGFQKKKEGETSAVERPRQRAQHYDQPQVAAVQIPRQNAGQNQNRVARPKTEFDPIPMTYTELYPHLVQLGLITTRSFTPRDPPPAGFRADLHCEFHQGAAGHDLEHCYALKARVQDLVRGKVIDFKAITPNVLNNPFPVNDK